MSSSAAPASSQVELWDRLAPVYDLQLFLERPALRAAARLAEPRADDRVLDLGTGTGALLRELASRDPRPVDVVGVDASERMLTRARSAAFPARWRLERGDARSLQFEEASFDLVFAAYLLNVLSDVDAEAVLREARRVLQPAGRLVIVSPVAPRSPVAGVYRRLAEGLSRRVPRFFGGIRLLDPEPIVRRAGLRPIRGCYVGAGYPSVVRVARADVGEPRTLASSHRT